MTSRLAGHTAEAESNDSPTEEGEGRACGHLVCGDLLDVTQWDRPFDERSGLMHERRAGHNAEVTPKRVGTDGGGSHRECAIAGGLDPDDVGEGLGVGSGGCLDRRPSAAGGEECSEDECES